MSPRASFSLALLTVLVAGIPLLRLSRRGSSPQEPAATAADAGQQLPAYMEARFSGRPLSLNLRCQGREIYRWDGEESPCSFEAELPQGSEAAVEAEAEWPEGAGENCIGLHMEEDGQEAVEAAAWSSGQKLHDVLILKRHD